MYVPNQDLDFHPHMLWYFFCLMWVKMREWFFVDIVELFTISLNFLFIIMMIFDMIEILSHIFGIQMYIICLSDYESNLKRWCMHNETCRRRILNKPEFCITQLKVPMLEIFVNYTPAPPEGGCIVLPLSVLPSVQDIFRRIFLGNYWWQKSDIWSQASYRYAILWEAFLNPSDSYFLFADLVGFYTHWTYMRGYYKWALAHSSSCLTCLSQTLYLFWRQMLVTQRFGLFRFLCIFLSFFRQL